MMEFDNIFHELAALLAVVTAVGALGVFLRQPLVVAFIAAGILLGPAGLHLVTATEPIILLASLGDVLGFSREVGAFLAGLTVAQISEFSLILAALGLSLGHISPETVGLITLVGLITISGSTYMILYSHRLYLRLAPLLGVFERRLPYREAEYDVEEPGTEDVLLFGLGRFGSGIATALRRAHRAHCRRRL